MERLFWRGRTVFLSTLLVGLSLVSSAHATTVQFVAVNLSDVTPGQDLWRYDYMVSGRTFQQSEFLDVYFNPLLYRTLSVVSGLNSSWDVMILQQPDPAKLQPFDRGILDAFALVNTPSLGGTLSVSFIYLGTGTPGAQAFDIFGANSGLLESGLTTPPGAVIPEPSTVVLSFLGMAAFMGKLRHARNFQSRV